jgi:hypothetical protein
MYTALTGSATDATRIFRSGAISMESMRYSDEHARLKEALEHWALSLGYTVPHQSMQEEIRPDVVLATPQIKLCGASAHKIKGGHFAIATNTVEAAQAWVPILNQIANRTGINLADGEIRCEARPDSAPDSRIRKTLAKSTVYSTRLSAQRSKKLPNH